MQSIALAAGLLTFPAASAPGVAADDLVDQVRFALEGSGVDISAVTVQEIDGIVTLTGTVESRSAEQDVIETEE